MRLDQFGHHIDLNKLIRNAVTVIPVSVRKEDGCFVAPPALSRMVFMTTSHSDTSRPFEKPKSERIAVKVINHLGDEVMNVFKLA